MNKSEKAVLGAWRITGMEVWDADYFDSEVPAHITLRDDLTGAFQFGLVQGDIDARVGGVGGVGGFKYTREVEVTRFGSQSGHLVHSCPSPDGTFPSPLHVLQSLVGTLGFTGAASGRRAA